MSNRKASLIVKDILRCIEHLETYTSNLSLEKFSADFMVVEACLYNIQIIGEAANSLSSEVKQKSPAVPWSLIKGMRNRLIHEYFGTDVEVVWNVIQNDLPDLKLNLTELHSELLSQGL